MSRIKRLGSLLLIITLGAFSSSMAQPGAAAPEALDLGPTSAQPGAARISITVALRMRALDEAESLLVSLHTPGDPQFRKFLTAEQFVARFAPAEADVAKVTAALAKHGLTVEKASALTLKVTGLPSDMERAFAVSLHSYKVPAHGSEPGYTFHAPLSRAVIPAEIVSLVSAVVGLDNRPSWHPHFTQSVYPSATSSSAGTINQPGFLTVTDFASYYDVKPLYKQGLSGKGRTLAIVTFANLTVSDVFEYWNSLGLKVDPNRLRIVTIDGGPGAPSDASGSIESTLDVQQSGGLAPGANIIVYLAPNTNQGTIDAFVQAAEDNKAQSVSTSWGAWEWFQSLVNSPVTDPLTGQTTGLNQAMHEQFVRSALQGQSLFAASADGATYDANHDTGCFSPYDPTQNYSCSATLSVDFPASDSAMTAAGGTTLPGFVCSNVTCANITQESVWGSDYGFCALLMLDPVSCVEFLNNNGPFPVLPQGSGGGVSVLTPLPSYQLSIPGIQTSQPGQMWQSTPAVAAALGITATSFTLPGNYAGRNVPDVSFNADPGTGYIIPYTSNVNGFQVLNNFGGTSFVAPQLNGLAALFGEAQGERLGLLNFTLYSLVRSKQAYGGRHPPLRAISSGDNWFYNGSPGYNLGAGVGVMDVANFASVLQQH